MKKTYILLIFWLMPFIVSAQEKPMVTISQARNWHDLVEESKSTGKPILIDAFATWCVPCRQMDKEVFTTKAVYDYINTNFIFVRVQMDTTKKDNDFVKAWHSQTDHFKKYVTAYPAFLFFDSNGSFITKEIGAFDPEAFIAVMKKSSDPNNNYSLQLRKFNEGTIARKEHLNLALRAQDSQDSITHVIAKSYKNKYIDSKPPVMVLNSDALFIGKFYQLFSSKDSVIRFMYFNQSFADSTLEKVGFSAQGIVDELISKDYIYPHVLINGEPVKNFSRWKVIEKSIVKDFDREKAIRLILNSKIFLAYKSDNLKEAAKLEIDRLNKFGFDTTTMGRAFVNNMMYSVVFKHSDDIRVLKKAAEVMKYINELESHKSSSHLDTYAGILYKAGDKPQAIKVEEAALNIAKEKKNEKNVQFFTDVIERMKKDEQIWKTE